MQLAGLLRRWHGCKGQGCVVFTAAVVASAVVSTELPPYWLNGWVDGAEASRGEVESTAKWSTDHVMNSEETLCHLGQATSLLP